jgi:hypothetical protein
MDLMTRPWAVARRHEMLRFILVAAIALIAVPGSYASQIFPQFYKIKVSLTNGNSVEGYSWGLSWMGGALLQEKKVRSANLKVEKDNVVATFTFPNDQNSSVYEQSAKDDQGKPRTLAVASQYEMFEPSHGLPGDAKFYVVSGIMECPLVEVSRIDTLAVIGKGIRISDPSRWLNLPEPYIVVEDCGLGCNVKMYSQDKDVTKDTLQKLWDQYFACGRRSNANKKVRSSIEERNKIEWISDPFCVD